MAISQPVSTDKLNSPDHSLMHRQIATDPSTPVQSLVIDASGAATIVSTVNAAVALTVTKNVATSGGCAIFQSTTGATGARNLVGIVNGSAAAAGTVCLNINQSGAGAALRIDYNTTVSDTIAPIHLDGCVVANGTSEAVISSVAPDSVLSDSTIKGWIVVKIDGGANNAYIPYWA